MPLPRVRTPTPGAIPRSPFRTVSPRNGEPPVVTLTGPRPPGGIEVAGGTVRIRFVEDAGTVTTEVADPPAPPGNKPLVTVRRRADGAPDVAVSGGRARVLILDPGDTGPTPAG